MRPDKHLFTTIRVQKVKRILRIKLGTITDTVNCKELKERFRKLGC